MAAETCQVRANLSSKEPKVEEWLIDMVKKKVEPEGGQSDQPKPRIQKVDTTLRNSESNEGCFEPLVVSLGPYYHGKNHLKPMECYKNVAGCWFVSLATSEQPPNTVTPANAENVYRRFVEKAASQPSLVDSYADEFEDKEVDLLKMMFLDGCFILHFIDLVVNGSKDDDDLSKMGKHLNRPLIIRDMFLLENQIPYSVLEHLMSLMPRYAEGKLKHSIEEFIFKFFLPPYEPYSEAFVIFIGFFFLLLFLPIVCGFLLYCELKGQDCTEPMVEANDGSSGNSGGKQGDQVPKDSIHGSSGSEENSPLHLLDLLRSKLIGEGARSPSQGTGYWDYCSRPIRELNAIGIQVKSSKETTLKDNVKFISGFIISDLELPQIIVDDSTKTRLLNLVAYEMCLDAPSDCQITSYICFLDSLIHDAGDVKELRSKNILLNRLGKDKDVAKLFKEMATNLSPDYTTYSKVMKGIDDHKNRRPKHVRLWIGQLIQTYFTSPWTLISLIAAKSLIVLTLLQTIYSILSYKKGSSLSVPTSPVA